MYKIYKIVDNTNGNVYIGITTQTLKRRLSNHRCSANTCISREIIKNGDYKIELIEETDDNTRERYWIENINCINITIPGRTQKEWREDNRDKYRKNYKEYNKKNKDKKAEHNNKFNNIRYKWYSSKCGSPYDNNMSLLKINPNLFYYETNPSMNGLTQ